MSTSVPPPSRALLVWGVAVAAYVVAVLNRSSLGVAGLETTERFDVGASLLATFAVAQLVVYAGLQIPVGVLLDRLGPRLLIAGGAVLMGVGQLVLAVATEVPGALAGRVLVGAGDAMTFVSVIRLIPAWFPVRRVPLLTQVTGAVGQLGQILSAVPLVLVLHGRGWGPAFGSLAVLALAAALLVAALVRDSPEDAGRRRTWRRRLGAPGERTAAEVLRTRAARPADGGALRAVVREPGVWLGFWAHFLTPFSSQVVVLLWGFSFFVEGQGRTTGEASALLSVIVVAGIVSGPLLGELAARRPGRRTRAVLVIAVAVAVAWVAVLAPPGPRGLGVLVVFSVVVAVGGPASLIGFDLARSCVTPARLGTATGLVNTGGFVAALTSMLAIGVALDVLAPSGDRDLDAYRWAFALMAVPWVVGVVGVLVSRARTRAAHPGIAL
ncbi:MFS transporter [Cellulomonas sp. NS3]|uniref:MFS transporter n=1 Tax=Cellulomonas sp. NS3 TaxID=2973977 RepID=UPI00216134E8|nr:MFS transporter [Cellulomonas sp. NS3]